MKIAIIDYGMGNLRSVEKALHFIGARHAFIATDPASIAAADKAILPGDGAFDATMDSLRASGIDRVVTDFAASGKPLLGICIGMQVLFTSSEEGREGVSGLDLTPGRVRRFPSQSDAGAKLTVPQIGWNELHVSRPSRLLADITGTAWVYFLHSYYCLPDDPSLTCGAAIYGVEYCAALERGNIFATQFHPEKSGNTGLTILRNFARL